MKPWFKKGENEQALQAAIEHKVSGLDDASDSYIHHIDPTDPMKQYIKDWFPLTNDDSLRNDVAKQQFLTGDVDDRIRDFESDDLDDHLSELEKQCLNISITISDLETQDKDMRSSFALEELKSQGLINQAFERVSSLQAIKDAGSWGNEDVSREYPNLENEIAEAQALLSQLIFERDSQMQLMQGALEANAAQLQSLSQELQKRMMLYNNIKNKNRS